MGIASRVPAPSRLLLALLALLGSGCAGRATPVPIPTLDVRREGADCLLVLLPGRWDRPADFRRAGFAEILATAGVAADVVAVDAHLGYYREESIVRRLRDDVVRPARRDGYETIWVAGNSLGGLGSLAMARELPEAVSGVVALSPFLGEDDLVEEIRRAGGAARWAATTPARPDEGVFAGMWRWLAASAGDDAGPPIILAYGAGDALAPANRLLAELLPAERVITVAGGHDWPTWTELWRRLVRTVPLCEPRPGPTGSS